MQTTAGPFCPVTSGGLRPNFYAPHGVRRIYLSVLIEEVESGLRSVPAGQREAALAGDFPHGVCFATFFCHRDSLTRQPVVGQYLNLMKLSSLASGIGFAELTYRVRQIESYNAHATEAFTVGTVLYLLTGMVTGSVLVRLGPIQGGKIMIPGFNVIVENGLSALGTCDCGRTRRRTALTADGRWRRRACPARRDCAGMRRLPLSRRGAQCAVCVGRVDSRDPLIFVIFWMWYLLPLITGRDLPARRPSRWRWLVYRGCGDAFGISRTESSTVGPE